MIHKNKQNGLGLVEVVVGVSLIAAALVGVVAGFHTLVRVSLSQTKELKSVYLLEGGAEAVRSIRDASWDTFASLSTDTTYFLSWSGTLWEATTTPQSSVDGLYRTVVFSDVYRDLNGDISATGTLDLNIRDALVSVSWESRGATTTESVSLYVANLF